MAERRNAETGFVDMVMADLGGTRSAALLERLAAAVDWEKLAAPIRRLPEYAVRKGPGRPAWPAPMMLRCLMLAKWFNLSDPGLEEALKDRISFRRFAGLSFTDATPDETTFVKFRARLREAGLHDVIFQNVLKQIDDKGLLVKEGTMVDATIIEAPRGRTRDDGTSTRDADASHTVKRGRPHFGYKAHIAADQSGIVTGWRFSTARHHDSRYVDELTEEETTAVIADSAYHDKERRRRLRERGVIDGIAYRRGRGQAKLHDWQERWNAIVARIRARVEHPIGMLKHQLGYRHVRYRGRTRNAFDLCMNLVACNIKRSLSLNRKPSPAG